MRLPFYICHGKFGVLIVIHVLCSSLDDWNKNVHVNGFQIHHHHHLHQPHQQRYQKIISSLSSLGGVFQKQHFIWSKIDKPNIILEAKANKKNRNNNSSNNKNFVDVEFERTLNNEKTQNSNNDNTDATATATTATTTKKKKEKKITTTTTPTTATDDDDYDDDDNNKKQTLLDWSLESSDLDWKSVRIPFIDKQYSKVIDATLAFSVDLDGVTYGIATPSDHAAAIAVEDIDGKVTNISPDDYARTTTSTMNNNNNNNNQENEELMEIMAKHLSEHVGEDLSLKRTPRVLTIQGDLDQYTKDWKSTLLPEPIEPDKFLQDEDDETIEWFHEFMKKELGQEEYDKTMAEPATAESIGDELMELFDVPGLGERENDMEGIERMIQSLLDEEDPKETFGEESFLDENLLDHPGAALKLVSFNFKNGKSYSLVKLLQPYTLVGRLDKTVEKGIQFELLTPEEEKLVIPKLEQVCQQDLKDAGLSLEK